MQKLEFRSFNDLFEKVSSFVSNVNLMDFDLIVAIPKSGMVPGYILGTLLNKPVLDFHSFLEFKSPSGGARSKNYNYDLVKKILIVDDSIKS